MPDTELLVAFLLATLVFAYMPGPSMMYAAAQTLARGRQAGWMAAIGIHLGGYVHVIAAAAGLSILFDAVPVLYTILKYLGALYLVWLGVQFFRKLDPTEQPEQLDSQSSTVLPSARKAFWQSVTVEMLNPKTALFYVAFLPQFTDIAALLPVWAQLLILGTAVNFFFSSADILSVVLADRVVKSLKRSARASRALRYVGGSVLIGLGINLAVARV